MFDKKVLNACSVIIGVFFIFSGFGKVLDTAAFSKLIAQYGFSYFMVLSPVIVILEIFLGLLLILLIKPKSSAFYSFLLLIFFTAAFAYAHFSKGVNDCGCFGTMKHTNISPAFSFVRNLLLIILSFLIWLKYPSEKTSTARWKYYVIILIMGISIFIAGYTFENPFMSSGKKNKHKFQNLPIKDTQLSKYLTTSYDSTYLVFCFSYNCPHCWNSIENLNHFKETRAVDSIIAFSTGSPTAKDFFNKNFSPDFSIIEMPADTISILADGFPTTFFIIHDTVKFVIQSVLPSPVTFKKQYFPQ